MKVKNTSLPKGTSALTTLKTLEILQCLAENGQPMSLLDIQRATNLGKTTCLRVLQALETKHVVQRDPQTKKYRIGLRLLEWGMAAVSTLGLQDVGRKYLALLSQAAGETAHVGVLDAYDVVYVGQHQPSNPIRFIARIGSRAPSHCTAMGKVLIAHLEGSERGLYFQQHPLTPMTPTTITERQAFVKELETVRLNGFSVDMEEHRIGVRCIAAPVRGQTGQVVAAMSISGPTERFSSDRLPELADLVRHFAQQVSEELGYVGSLID